MSSYIITEEQLKKFVDELQRYYGDHRVHTSCVHLSDKWDKTPKDFDEEIQFWVDGEKFISLPLKLADDKND
jgi:hypothetical protein